MAGEEDNRSRYKFNSANEFSRDSLLEGKPGKPVRDQVSVPDTIDESKNYGMHRHFTDAGCVPLFGGGMKRGHLHGLTADERPCKTIKDRVAIEDLHATMYNAMGISPKLAMRAMAGLDESPHQINQSRTQRTDFA